MVSLESYLSYSAWFLHTTRQTDGRTRITVHYKIELFVSFTQGPFAVKQLDAPPIKSPLFMTQIEMSPLWRG